MTNLIPSTTTTPLSRLPAPSLPPPSSIITMEIPITQSHGPLTSRVMGVGYNHEGPEPIMTGGKMASTTVHATTRPHRKKRHRITTTTTTKASPSKDKENEEDFTIVAERVLNRRDFYFQQRR